MSFALAWLAIAPAHAILPATGEAETSPAPAETQTIDQSQDAGTDTRIEQRIAGIFRELPSFSGVTAQVSDGVVTLSGTVAEDADIARAGSIVGRIQGVVTIENQLERDLTVESGLGALGALSDRISSWLQHLPLIGLALLVGLVIASIGYLIAGLKGLWTRVMPNRFLAELVASAIRFVFVILGLVVALDMIGAAALLGAVLGGAGVIGIALGFAMRDTVENYVASLMLSLRQPFRANDHVLIDDMEGRVIRLTSRATVLMTLDGNHLRIPNSQVFKGVILNYTTNPQRRFEFVLGVDADDDPRAARELGKQVLSQLPFVLDEPPPEAMIEGVGDSNISISFLAWVDQREADFNKARSQAIPAVKDALEEAGFGLPEPIYRLRFDPRTQPLPFQNIGSEKAQGAEASDADRPSKKPSKPAGETEDVRPQDEIAQMVEAERAEDGGNDLLDEGRPTE